MKKLQEWIGVLIAAAIAVIGLLIHRKGSAGDNAARNEAIADEHEEMADLREVEAAEELAVAHEENKAAQEIADSIDPIKDDKTPVNHVRKKFDFH